MRFTTLALPLIAASAASARIIGIAAPSTIEPNSTFSLTLLVENYIQAVADVSVAWGFSPVPGYPDSLGTLGSGSAYLGPAKSNTRTNVTVAANTPVTLEVGKQYVLSASVFSLYGASFQPTLANANVTFTAGTTTSDDKLVRSDGFTWGNGAGC